MMGYPQRSRSGLFLEIRLWRDGPASRKSPHVRFLSATYISHRIVAGEACPVIGHVKIPTSRKGREKWGTHFFLPTYSFAYLGIGSNSKE